MTKDQLIVKIAGEILVALHGDGETFAPNTQEGIVSYAFSMASLFVSEALASDLL